MACLVNWCIFNRLLFVIFFEWWFPFCIYVISASCFVDCKRWNVSKIDVGELYLSQGTRRLNMCLLISSCRLPPLINILTVQNEFDHTRRAVDILWMLSGETRKHCYSSNFLPSRLKIVLWYSNEANNQHKNKAYIWLKLEVSIRALFSKCIN